MNSKLFDDFLKLDPFIYRRHPSLNEDEQKKLLLSVINKLHNEEYKLYGKWKYLDGTSIVKYPKISNLTELVQNHTKKTDINLLTFTFLLKLLEFNYDQELENFIFDILENIEDKKKFISYTMIDNHNFNLRLLDFSYNNDLLEKNLYSSRSFETKFFQSLYGIHFQYSGKTICKYTNIDIIKLFDLLEYIPINDLKLITPYIHSKDIEKWFKYLKSNYDKKKHNAEYITWFVYALLKDKTNISEIVDFLFTNGIITLHLHTKDIALKFDEIDNELWEMFFKSEEYSDHELAINDLLSFYNIYYSDIEQLSRKYSISEFPDKYKYFRTRVENIDQFLMANATFKQYIENMIEKQKQNEKKLQENWENRNPELAIQRKKEKRIIQNNLNTLEKLYQDSITHFITKSDFYNIFSLAYRKSNDSFFELNNKLKIDLKDKYIEYIKILKDIFKDDKTYISLKNDLISNKLSYNETLMFIYLFNILDVQEKELLLNTNENYTKLFWHLYRYNDYMNSDFFQKISNKYHIELEKLSIEVIQLSLEQSKNKKIGFSYILKELLIRINIYNKISMPNLIIYIESISQEVYSTLEEAEKEIFLEILALNKENFDFIKNMMLKDKDNCHWYLNHLLSINKNLAIEHFNNLIYNKISNKRSGWLVVSLFLGLSTESKCHEYHNPKINPEKIQSFLCFMKAMKKHTFEDIDSSILKIILVDYYQFFNEYTIPSGSYTPDMYDYMNSKINNLWRYLENTTEHIELLKELTTINSNNISNLANYSLNAVYKLQANKRDITNDYYKKIFDTNTTVEHRTIYNNGNYVEKNNGNMSIK